MALPTVAASVSRQQAATSTEPFELLNLLTCCMCEVHGMLIHRTLSEGLAALARQAVERAAARAREPNKYRESINVSSKFL